MKAAYNQQGGACNTELNAMLNRWVIIKVAVYKGEMVAILLALNWVEEVRLKRVLVSSDSNSTLISIQNM